jgi:hypothetical protein
MSKIKLMRERKHLNLTKNDYIGQRIESADERKKIVRNWTRQCALYDQKSRV